MEFSRRVGMEPAVDLKRRIRSLCEEAGFVVSASQISMRRGPSLQESVRLVVTSIREPEWRLDVPTSLLDSSLAALRDHQIEVLAFIGCDGTFNGTVRVLCSAQFDVGDVWAPTLRNFHVPIGELPHWLPEVTRQMREVMTRRQRGETGPWLFSDGATRWEAVSLFGSGGQGHGD